MCYWPPGPDGPGPDGPGGEPLGPTGDPTDGAGTDVDTSNDLTGCLVAAIIDGNKCILGTISGTNGSGVNVNSSNDTLTEEEKNIVNDMITDGTATGEIVKVNEDGEFETVVGGVNITGIVETTSTITSVEVTDNVVNINFGGTLQPQISQNVVFPNGATGTVTDYNSTTGTATVTLTADSPPAVASVGDLAKVIPPGTDLSSIKADSSGNFSGLVVNKDENNVAGSTPALTVSDATNGISGTATINNGADTSLQTQENSSVGFSGESTASTTDTGALSDGQVAFNDSSDSGGNFYSNESNDYWNS